MKFTLRRKRKSRDIEGKQLLKSVKLELGNYIKREDLQGYLNKIESDERRKRVWDSLSERRKLKLLRYVSERKGGSYGKK